MFTVYYCIVYFFLTIYKQACIIFNLKPLPYNFRIFLNFKRYRTTIDIDFYTIL